MVRTKTGRSINCQLQKMQSPESQEPNWGLRFPTPDLRWLLCNRILLCHLGVSQRSFDGTDQMHRRWNPCLRRRMEESKSYQAFVCRLGRVPGASSTRSYNEILATRWGSLSKSLNNLFTVTWYMYAYVCVCACMSVCTCACMHVACMLDMYIYEFYMSAFICK